MKKSSARDFWNSWALYRDGEISISELEESYENLKESSKLEEMSLLDYQDSYLTSIGYNEKKLDSTKEGFLNIALQSTKLYFQMKFNGLFDKSYYDFIFNYMIKTPEGKKKYSKIKDKKVFEKFINKIQNHLDTYELEYKKKYIKKIQE